MHPLALDELLAQHHLATDGLRSKSWDEFVGAWRAENRLRRSPSATTPRQEVCPVWPGQPMTAHWGIEDPAAVEGSDDVKQRAFAKAFQELDARIKIFVSLPFDKLDRLALQERLHAIGASEAGLQTRRTSYLSPRTYRRNTAANT